MTSRSRRWNGNDLDTCADDLATLVKMLDLKNAIHVGHSSGGGEVALYIGWQGTKRVAKAELYRGVRRRSGILKTEDPQGQRTEHRCRNQPIECFRLR